MSAFESAWDLLKEYTPNWREQARKLPYVGISYNEGDRHFDTPSLHYPIGGKPMTPMQMNTLSVGGGSFMDTFIHPADSRFVMKVPVVDSGFGWRDSPSETIGGRIGDINEYGQGLAEILESLGFPVVSEFDVGGEYTVMPRLNNDRGTDNREKDNRKANKPNFGIADLTLNHILGDRHTSNWGTDSIDNWRMLDVDAERADPTDYWPLGRPEKSRGEMLQEGYNKFGVQLPASKILNILDMSDVEHQGMRALMEEIEPHSDNPRFVTVDGRPVWREGYDRL